MKENIIFIGMPGVGKSTIGVVLAKHLGYSFVDSDLVIQEKKGMRLHEIIEKEGLKRFQQIENEVNRSLDCHKAVIATGGSAVYGGEAMEHLKKNGVVVYLMLPFEELKERLGDLEERGVFIREEQTLWDLYEERTPLYEKYAEKKINCHEKTIREIVHEIAEWRKEEWQSKGN